MSAESAQIDDVFSKLYRCSPVKGRGEHGMWGIDHVQGVRKIIIVIVVVIAIVAVI